MKEQHRSQEENDHLAELRRGEQARAANGQWQNLPLHFLNWSPVSPRPVCWGSLTSSEWLQMCWKVPLVIQKAFQKEEIKAKSWAWGEGAQWRERKGGHSMQWVRHLQRPQGNRTWQVKGSHCSKEQRLRHAPNIQNDGASYRLEQDWKLGFPYDSTSNYTFHHHHSRSSGQSHFTLTAHCLDLWIQWEGKRQPVRIVDIFHGLYLWSLSSCQQLRHKLQKYCQGLFLVSVKTAFFFKWLRSKLE